MKANKNNIVHKKYNNNKTKSKSKSKSKEKTKKFNPFEYLNSLI